MLYRNPVFFGTGNALNLPFWSLLQASAIDASSILLVASLESFGEVLDDGLTECCDPWSA
jgi:hypothetical protein